MTEAGDERSRQHRQFAAVHAGFVAGDGAVLAAAEGRGGYGS